MRFLITSLPSMGKVPHGNVEEINIEPLTYKQIIQFQNKTDDNPVSKLIFDIENLVMDIDGWQDIPAYDLSSIMFTRKYISATTSESIKIEVGNQLYDINVSQITFKEINQEYIDLHSIKLNNTVYDVHCPNIEEYYKVLKAFEPNYPKEPWITPYDLMILTSLGADHLTIMDYIYMFGNLKEDDVATVEYLDTIINNITNDITIKAEGGETVVSVNKLITDLFRFISINRQFDVSKINAK